MSNPENKPLRPPLRPSDQPLPKGSGFGKTVTDDAGAAAALERNGDSRPADSPSPVSARRSPARLKGPASATFTAAKEKTLRAARDLRRKFGQGLTREESIRLVSAFRSAVVPRRKPGRRPKPHVTAAYRDWKAGVRAAVALCMKHIPGWQNHNRYRRMAEQKRLMDAIRSRYRRERAKVPVEGSNVR